MKARDILHLLLTCSLLSVLCMGCATRRPVDNSLPPTELDKEQVWQLVAMRGKEVAKTPEVVLMFHPESGTLRGNVVCNRYFADYSLRLDRVTADGTRYNLKVLYASGGDVQCPEGDMAFQERYIALLGKADACLLTPYTLTLFQKGKETLKYELQ